MGPPLRALAPCCSERSIQLDHDKLVVIGLSGAQVTTDAKGEVVIVEHADVARAEEEHIFDGFERKRETESQPHVSWKPIGGESQGVVNVQQVDRKSLGDELARAIEGDLKDGLEAVQIALRTVSLNDQA